jgi:NO-binding membrane sensor protein with MHYT domain
MGGTDLSGLRVITYLGTDSSYSGNELGVVGVSSDVIVILSRNATVNFRSRDFSGLHFIANFTYGYECPKPYRLGSSGSCEIGLMVGDVLNQELSGTSIVLAFGIAVLGSWTSLILVEQAIFHHLCKLVTWPWLLLSSVSLGNTYISIYHPEYTRSYCLVCAVCLPNGVSTGAGMWATLLIGMSSIDVPPLTVSFAAPQSIGSLFLPFALVYSAFHILLGETGHQYFRRRKAGLPSESRPSENKKRSLIPAYIRSIVGVTRKGSVAAMLVTIGLVALHWSLYSGLLIAADISYNAGIVIIGMVVGFVLCGAAAHLFFHYRTSQFRFIAAFVMAGGICGFHFITLSSVTYRYLGGSPTPQLSSQILQILGKPFIIDSSWHAHMHIVKIPTNNKHPHRKNIQIVTLVFFL